MRRRVVSVAALAVLLSGPATGSAADRYANFEAAIYARAYEVREMGDLERLRARFEVMEKHVKVSKMYLETHRDKILVDGETLEKAKGFFEARGIRTAGGITLTIDERNRFETFCYSDPDAPELGAAGRRAHRAALRRDHPRRLLLHELQVRGRDPRAGRAELDRVPPGAAGRGGPQPRPGPGAQGQPEGEGGHQVPELVRPLPRPGVQPGDAGRRSSTRSTRAPRRATRCAAPSTCSRTTGTRSGATWRTSARATTRGDGSTPGECAPSTATRSSCGSPSSPRRPRSRSSTSARCRSPSTRVTAPPGRGRGRASTSTRWSGPTGGTTAPSRPS